MNLISNLPKSRSTVASMTLAFLVSHAESAEFSVDITVLRRGDPSEKIVDAEVTVVPFGETTISGKNSSRTDKSGKAKIRFRSKNEKPQVNFKFTEENPQLANEKWHLYHHGVYDAEDTARDTPFSFTSEEEETPLDAFPHSELSEVIGESLDGGYTALFSELIASVTTISSPKGGLKDLPDPLRWRDNLSEKLDINSDSLDDFYSKWSEAVLLAPKDEKPEEKSLVFLLQGDLSRSATYAIEAKDIQKREGDPPRLYQYPNGLLTSVHFFNEAALNSSQSDPSTTADRTLTNVRVRLDRVIPDEIKSISAENPDWSPWNSYSKQVRMVAARDAD